MVGYRRGIAAMGALALLVGCVPYGALPLDTHAALAPDLAALDPAIGATPLTVPQVMTLALERNPGLRAVRARRGIAQAQLIQSGLLPNPVLSGAFLPLIAGGGTVPAWTAGLTQDIKALVTYRARRRGARDAAAQVDADIVWQEWQVAGQARQIAVDLVLGERTRPLLQEALGLLAHRNAVVRQALAAGDVTLVTAAPSAVGLQAARAAVQALDQRQLTLHHQLAALLALAPDAAIPLSPTLDLPPFDPAAIRATLATLPDRRPDLLALRLGYAAQDQAVRAAILAQFPDLVLGGGASSDSSRVINAGPNATLALPIFDRNQGNIAIAVATRAQLHADYAARLATATGEVEATLREMALLSEQLAVVRRDLPAARLAARRAAAAFSASSLDERSFVDLVTNRYTKEQDVLTLETGLLDRQVALDTLLGAGLPAVSPLPAAEPRR